MKCAAAWGRGLHPNRAAVAAYDTATDGQSDASTGIVPFIVQALEDFKDPLVMLWGNADTVVADRKSPFVLNLFR